MVSIAVIGGMIRIIHGSLCEVRHLMRLARVETGDSGREAHAPLCQIGELGLDLVGDVPEQDQYLIRRVVAQGGGRADGDIAAGQVFALFGRGGVADVGQ